jgi:hypothetical protein
VVSLIAKRSSPDFSAVNSESCYLPSVACFILPIGLLYHSGDQVKKTEMGRTCGTYGGEERCIQGFSGET